MLDLITPMSLFHFLLQVRHLHRMALAMMMIYLDLQVIRILTFLMRSCRMTIWVMILQTWGEPEAVLLDRDRDLMVNQEDKTVIYHQAVLPYRYQMIVTHPWSSYLMGLTVHHLMMTIRRILWKFTWSPLLQEDLQMHQGQNNHLLILIRSCNRHLTCHRPLLSRLFHFRNIRIFRFQAKASVTPVVTLPGLPVTEGEFPIIHETPAPSDQDKVKAGTVTPEMQRRYAKEIKSAKLDEFKSYLDNGALRLADKRKLSKVGIGLSFSNY
ncbi:GIP, partial [Symbiodinium sp. KB8]